MAQQALEKLFFSIGLIDKVTGPSTKITKHIKKMQNHFTTGMSQMALGGAGLVGVALSMNKVTDAARDFSKAKNEVLALGTATAEVAKLGKTAKLASMEFGGSASDIVRAGYDIQSSIAGLENGELAKFTYNSAMLAKATKSDTATITGYVSTMSGAFSKEMDKMGKSKWMEALTGKTAKAVQMFRTTGSEMSAAFAKFGAVGSSKGVGMDEQMSVVGMLQQVTGSGAEAATQYSAFLDGVFKSQDKLGLKFTDANNKLLPMADILTKIKGKFGETFTAADSNLLKEAFGKKEAVKAITSMIGKTDELQKNIIELGKIKGVGVALDMAKIQVDPLEQFQAISKVLLITLGETLLPVINTVLSLVGKFAKVFYNVMMWFPPLRWAIGAVVIALASLAVAWGVLRVSMGIGNMWTALTMKLHLMKIALWKANVITGNMTFTQKVAAIANYAYQRSLSAISAALKFLKLDLLLNKVALIASSAWAWIVATAQTAMSLGFIGSSVAVWGFTAALLACPLTWIVVAIMVLVGAIVALIYYWDEVCAWVVKYADYILMTLGPIGLLIVAIRNLDVIFQFLKDLWQAFKTTFPNIANLAEKLFHIWWSGVTGMWTFWKGVWNNVVGLWNNVIANLADGFLWIYQMGGAVWDGMLNGLQNVTSWISDLLLPAVLMIGDLFGWLDTLGDNIWSKIIGVFTSMDGWIGSVLNKLALIPGLGFLDTDVTVNGTASIKDKPVVPSVKLDRQKRDIAAGGGAVSNNKTTNYGGITINNSGGLDMAGMEEHMLMGV